MIAEPQVQVPSRPRKTVLLRDKKERKQSSPDDTADITKWKFVDKHELQDPHKDYVTFNKRPETIKEFSKSKKSRYDSQEPEETFQHNLRSSQENDHHMDSQNYTSQTSLASVHLSPTSKSSKRRNSFKSWDNNFHYLSEFLTDEEKMILIEELEEIGIPRPPSAIWRPATVPPAPPLSAAHFGLFHLNRNTSDDNLNSLDSPLTARDMDFPPRPHSQSYSKVRPESQTSFEGNSNPYLPAPSRRLERVPSFSELPLSTINNMLNAPSQNPSMVPMNASTSNFVLEKRLERTGSVSDMLVRPRPRASTLPERLLDSPLPPLMKNEFRLDLPPSSPLKNANTMLSPSSNLRASKKIPLDSLGLLGVGFEPEPEPTGRDLLGRSARGNQFVLEVQELIEVPTDFGPNSSTMNNGPGLGTNPFVVITAPSGMGRTPTPTGSYLGVSTTKSRATTPNRLTTAPRSSSREKSPSPNRSPKTPPVDSSLPRIGTELRPFMYKEKFDTLMNNFSKAVTITDISDEEWKRIAQSDSGMASESPHSQAPSEPPMSGRL